MGYDAFVPCNCYKEGKTVDPPHKEYVVYDAEEGIWLLKLPSGDYNPEMEAELDDWENNACEHENMCYASERLANIWGMALFRGIVQELGGKERFPVLMEYLPTCNGGFLPAERVRAALRELLDITEDETPFVQWMIQEVESGDTVAEGYCDADSCFSWFGYYYRMYAGISGFIIAKENPLKQARPDRIFEKELGTGDNAEYHICFQSKNFIQQRTEKRNSFLFVDKLSEKSYPCDEKIYPQEGQPDRDYEFKLERKTTPVKEFFQYILEPLQRLFHASLETGNPVYWC